MAKVSHPYAVVTTFIWIGCLLAISFMESWLKFQAPGVDLTIGLGIGKRVFQALNYIEIFLALSTLIYFLVSRVKLFNRNYLIYAPVLLALLVQTVWLLPAMDQRADRFIAGENPGPSSLHYFYIGLEILKLGCLFAFGLKQLKR